MQAQSHNHDGQYQSAKQCGELALCCNILVILKYILLVIAGVVVVVLFLTGVLVFAGTSASSVIPDSGTICIPHCTINDYTGDVQCYNTCN